jgi:tetratricopeptide (TPR) repeat protein
MVRLIFIVLVFGLSAANIHAQERPAPPQNAATAYPSKAEILRRIDLYETALREPDANRSDEAQLARLYVNLGACYLEVAMYPKAEDAMHHAIALLHHGSPAALADEIGQLAILHIAMGELKQASKDQLDALKIREQIGDPVGIALTWNDLASLYIRQRHFAQALRYAERSEPLLASNTHVSAIDRIAVRETLAYAFSGVHQFERAIPLLQEALQLARDNFGSDSLNAGLASYLLGYAYWQEGEPDQADHWMQQGINRMKKDWGWGHVLYVNSVEQYAKFLRQRGQLESASLEERELKQMAATVDARSFAAR